MYNKISTISFTLRIWALMALLAAIAVFAGIYFFEEELPIQALVFIYIGTSVFSIPALVILNIFGGNIRDTNKTCKQKLIQFFRLLFIIVLLYGVGIALLIQLINFFGSSGEYLFIYVFFGVTCGLFLLSFISILLLWKTTCSYLDPYNGFYYTPSQFFNTSSTTKNTINMEPAHLQPQQPAANNRTMIKGFITGGLILLMMIPTLFITSLIDEREARQKEIVKEVSSKWATAQTLSSPFLVVPYSYTYQGSDGKNAIAKTNLILLANDVAMTVPVPAIFALLSSPKILFEPVNVIVAPSRFRIATSEK
ncbi:MAG: hypothetical protein EOP53_03730 [Sphingobacteriales bacterium]|nr:MAG: hypothetical protein EOP53_03730 [Sphingobacteriales bacterium]